MADLSSFTDEELEAISNDRLDLLSEEKLTMLGALDDDTELPSYDTGKTTEDILMSLGQGITSGHLPQVGAALKTRSTSGPEYESQKKSITQRLEQREPITGLLAETAGGMVGPAALGGARLLKGGASALRAAAVGAGQGFLQSPGGDVGVEQIPQRLTSAAIGGGLGGGLAKAGEAVQRGLESFAERRAFSSLRPFKQHVKDARLRGSIEPVGRELLDQDIIGNIPRSSEKIAERISERKGTIGAQKSQVIDDVQGLVDRLKMEETSSMPAIPGQREDIKAGIRVQALKDEVKGQLKLNEDLPQSKQFSDKLDDFLSTFASGKEYLSVKEADKLKTDLGRFVRKWYRPGAIQTEPHAEQFNKELYRALNKGVDDAAELMAKTYKPDIVEDLRSLKKSYGNLSEAEKIAGSRFEADFANRMVSPSDYGAGIGAAAGSMARGNPVSQAGIVGAAAAGINQFLRKYGNQITAKQADNLSKLVGSKSLQNVIMIQPALTATTRKRRIKSLEE